MAAVRVNLQIDQGADFSAIFNLTDGVQLLDLNDYTVEAVFGYNFSTTNRNNFTIDILDAINGKVELKLSASQTSALKLARYVYDILVTASEELGGAKTRIVEGVLEISPGVS
jgi:hypothetical protein